MSDPNGPFDDPYNDNEPQPGGENNAPADGPDPYDLDEPVEGAPLQPPPPPAMQGPPSGTMRCQNCQQDLSGATLGGHCPQCGAPIVAAGYQTGQSSGKAVASLVLGIISIPTCLCCGLLGVILGPLAIMFAKQAQRDIANGTVSPGSGGMASAGFICGIIGTALGGISLVLGILGQVLPLLTNP